MFTVLLTGESLQYLGMKCYMQDVHKHNNKLCMKYFSYVKVKLPLC